MWFITEFSSISSLYLVEFYFYTLASEPRLLFRTNIAYGAGGKTFSDMFIINNARIHRRIAIRLK